MNAPNISKADFSALLERAESRFHAWYLKELRPERNRRISDLQKQNLTSAGRAHRAMQIYKELLERDVRERIGFYASVARDSGNSEMLSKQRLEELRDRIMTSVGCAVAALKGQIERDARQAGDVPQIMLPDELRYVQLKAQIFDVVNAELRVLEAEGKLASLAEIQCDPNAIPQPERTKNLREAFVLPILDKKGWSLFDWANNSAVDPHTVNDYLKGETHPYPSTRKKLADSLGVAVENLPK